MWVDVERTVGGASVIYFAALGVIANFIMINLVVATLITAFDAQSAEEDRRRKLEEALYAIHILLPSPPSPPVLRPRIRMHTCRRYVQMTDEDEGGASAAANFMHFKASSKSAKSAKSATGHGGRPLGAIAGSAPEMPPPPQSFDDKPPERDMIEVAASHTTFIASPPASPPSPELSTASKKPKRKSKEGPPIVASASGAPARAGTRASFGVGSFRGALRSRGVSPARKARRPDEAPSDSKSVAPPAAGGGVHTFKSIVPVTAEGCAQAFTELEASTKAPAKPKPMGICGLGKPSTAASSAVPPVAPSAAVAQPTAMAGWQPTAMVSSTSGGKLVAQNYQARFDARLEAFKTENGYVKTDHGYVRQDGEELLVDPVKGGGRPKPPSAPSAPSPPPSPGYQELVEEGGATSSAPAARLRSTGEDDDVSLMIFAREHPLRLRARALVAWRCGDSALSFDNLILVVILASSIAMAFDSCDLEPASPLAWRLAQIDIAAIFVFVVELVAKVIAPRLLTHRWSQMPCWPLQPSDKPIVPYAV